MKLKIITLLLCCFSLVSAWSQTTVSGMVTDEDKMPLIGVTVIINGTSKGASTDFDGNFNIKVNEGQTLNFSYIGYETQEIKISSEKIINIVLKESAARLDEIVVVGYGRQKKESILGAIEQVKGSVLLESGAANVSDALNGIAPGLNIIQTSGQPGDEDSEIYIRGNANPLILVDGIEVVGGFTNMNSNDIETISVLKDGSATAVYGIRGANGVILITTKRGRTGAPKVSFSSVFTLKQFTDNADTVDAFTAQSLLNVGILNDQAYSRGYSSDETLALLQNGSQPYRFPSTDWVDVGTKDFATSLNQTISLRGGNDFVKYYGSAGYLQEGDISATEQLFNYDPSYKFQRYSFRANLDFKLTKTTKLKTSVSSRLEKKNQPGNGTTNKQRFLSLYTAAPNGIPYYPADALDQFPDPLYPGLSEFRLPIGGNIYTGTNANGAAEINKTVFSTDLELEQDLSFITKGLKFTVKYNYVSSSESMSRISFDTALQARLDAYTLTPDGSWISFEGRDYERPEQFLLGGESIRATSDITTTKAQLNYNRSFGKHNVTGLGLLNRSKRTVNSEFPYFEESWVIRTTYDYDKHYFFEMAGAYNGDETFARGERFKLFPSFSGGINLAKEKFIADNIPAINNFKVRYSYGQTGTKNGLRIGTSTPIIYNRWQYLSFFDYLSTRATSRFYFGENLNSTLNPIVEDQAGNLFLTWSTVTKQNIGLDFGFFDNKISGKVDFFKDEREDLINRPSADVPIFYGSTAALPFVNLGKSESHGFEATLTYKDRTEGGLAYSITGNYGFNENRVLLSAADGLGTPEYTTIAGKPSGTTALLQTDGYFQNIDEVVNYPVTSGNPGLGDFRYIDYNANGTVVGNELEDQVRFDIPKSPKHSFSVNLNLSYKAWSMSALVNGIAGHKGVSNSSLAYALPSGVASSLTSNLDYWTPTNTDASRPALHTLNNPNLASTTSDRIINLDYIKLRSMNIGYNFDMEKSKQISALKLYINGNNLFTFSNIDFGDPEGNNPGSYPILRRINLGLNLSF